ncbi:proline-rich receptor-like protein kinase PERK1 [Hevea brasiliensis]|uniref:proline-rich receptor-like protein kinase PERK1 n=1 Tax=Hevea brasiliensis TaxID=3981 RepID=UPI0025F501E3|nr:proline-rich receptor-like protein kinase PERK1 [Hevea brasiliensis]
MMSSTQSFSPACEPRKFEFEELAKATRYFSNEQLVGIGDFGDVYEGSLPGVKVNIAVKKLKYKQDEKQEEEFKNQIKDFGIVSHPNLVKLLGYCCKEANRLLVLEFVPNKSLRFHLSDENRRSNLSWSKRMKIAVGSARGLAHLHDECYPKIIHGNIKSDNILLDNDFTPKVADFGLAKIFSEIGVSHIPFDQEEDSVYIDPENYYFQNIFEKSDVYSFGVILLELITGRRLLSKGQVDIVNWVKTRIIKGNSIKVDYDSFVDSALKEYDKSEMKRMIYCAAASLYGKSSKSRPTMEQIVGTLEGKISCEELWVLEVNTGKASESRSSKAGDMSETTSSPFQELKEITEASNLHWSKATSSQGIEPEIMQIQEMHAKSHYSALEQAATLSETSLEATAHNVMPSSRLMKVYHILNEIMTRIGNPNMSTIGVC